MTTRTPGRRDPSGNDDVTQGRNGGLATGWCLQLLPDQSKQYLAVQLLTHTHSLAHTGPLPDSITHTSLTLLTQAEKHAKSRKGERRRRMWCKTPEWCVRDVPRGFALAVTDSKTPFVSLFLFIFLSNSQNIAVRRDAKVCCLVFVV